MGSRTCALWSVGGTSDGPSLCAHCPPLLQLAVDYSVLEQQAVQASQRMAARQLQRQQIQAAGQQQMQQVAAQIRQQQQAGGAQEVGSGQCMCNEAAAKPCR